MLAAINRKKFSMKSKLPVHTLSGLLLCVSTFCLGEEAVIKNGDFSNGLNSWTPSWKAEPFFELKKDKTPFVRYSRSKDQSPELSVRLKQDITLKPGFYDLSIEYQTDDTLAPMIYISAPDKEKKPQPFRIIRLPNNPARTVFNTRLFVGKNHGAVTLEFAPGTRAGNLIKNNQINSTWPGQVDLYSIRLTPSSFAEPELPPADRDCRTEKVVYKTVGDLQLVMYLDFPKQPASGKMPVIFWVHGGGWIVGSPDDMRWRSAPLAQMGIANARVQYRLIKDGGTFPETFQDLRDAVQWLRDHAKEYNIDMNRMVISGGSAGGQLSSILAQKTPECIGYVGMCGIYDLTDIGTSRFGRSGQFLLGNDPQVLINASAFHNIRTNPPAALLIHGEADSTIDYMQAVRFAEEIRKHGGRAETLILEGGGHDFGYPYATDTAINRFLASLGFPVK